MDINKFNKEFQKIIDNSDFWDDKQIKKRSEEYADKNGKIDYQHMISLIRMESAQYTNELVYNALRHFLVDHHKY